MENVLIFARGDLNDGVAVRAAVVAADTVIAADGGAAWARRIGVEVAMVIGDMDSINPYMLNMLERTGTEIIRYPMEKDETDLELALLEAAKRGARWIRVAGAVGDRLDQTLANVYLLNRPELEGLDVKLVYGYQTAWLAKPGDHPIMGVVGDTISLIPLSGGVTGITTTGLQYPLQNETLYFGPARGISNVISETEPRVHFEEGVMLIVHTVGRA